MTTTASSGDAVGRIAELTLGIAAGIVLFAMMTLTFVDVAGRKFFSKPVYGAYEITEFLLGTLIFCALPLVTARGGHVTIDVLDNMIPRALRGAQNAIMGLISALTLAFIAWRLVLLGPYYAANNEVSMTLYIAKSPFAYFFAAMAALAAIAALALTWSQITGRARTRPSGSFDTAT